MNAVKTDLWPRLNRYIPIWPTPHQAAFMALPGLEALYGGAAGGGKSVALLAAALMYVDVPGYSALILRRSYRGFEQHGGLVDLANSWLAGTDAVWKEDTSTWRFPSGATLAFRHLHDVGHLQGSEYAFIGVDELSEVDEADYRYLFARLRSKVGSPIPSRMRATANPIGPGAAWVHQRFLIEGGSAGRVFIPARLEHNPHLDRAGYEASLAELPWYMRPALEEGRWDLRPEGGLFQRAWFEGVMVELAQVPSDLSACRFWDLAATKRRAGTDPDFTVGLLLGRDGDGVFYVIDVIRAQASDLEVVQLIRQAAIADQIMADSRGWRSLTIGIEQEPGAAAVHLIGEFRRGPLAGYDVRGVRATGSKEQRARPLSSVAQAGELRVRRDRWNRPFLDELCAFPAGAHDDQVDALAGAARLLLAERRGRARVVKARFGHGRTIGRCARR